MRRLFLSVFTATALLVTPAAFAQDRTDMDTHRAAPAPTTTTTVADRNDDTGFNPGWFGLAGLIGLLGLMPRDNTYKTYGRTTTTGTTSDLNR